jgi:eukaryotic-like serine/threonine-protein kinase
MPAPATVDGFLETVRKSRLLEAGELNNYLQQSPELPTEPYKLATLMVRQGLLTQFQAKQLLQGRYRGFYFGKYKVLDPIGAGGTAAVYQCEHLLMHRFVALKILPKEKAADKACLERFYREARAVAALDHPNIVRAHDIDQEGPLHFLVMEYVDGKSLHDIVANHGPLSPERVAHYLYQAASGLAHAQERGIVHRDIKPANLLLDRQGTVKILEMGLASFFDAPSEKLAQQAGELAVLGNVDYVSPEQAVDSHSVDIRADIYSLGATGYYLLTGRPPFDGGNVAQKLLAHQMKEPPPIASRRNDVPQELVEIITRMMRKAPAERYLTPAELMAALAKWVATPIAPPPDAEMPKRRIERIPDSAISALSAPAATSNPASNSGSRLKFYATPPPTPTPPLREEQVGLFDTASPLPGAALNPLDNLPDPKASTRRRRKDTAPMATPPPAKRAADPKPPKKLIWVVCTAVILFLVGVGALVGWLMPKSRPPKPREMIAAEKPLLVFRLGAGLGTFGSLREALAHVQPGGRIVIRGDLEESGVDENGKSIFDTNATNVTIVPEQAEGVIQWRPPPGHPADQPLVHITNVNGLRLKNFALDGAKRVDTLLLLQGNCASVRLENFAMIGFNRCGIRFRNCSGDVAHPVTLERFHCRPAAGAAAAIIFDEGPEGSKAATTNVKIIDSRIDGPCQAAIRVQSSLVEVLFERDRFHRASVAIEYEQHNPPHSLGLSLRQSTLAEIDSVFHLQTLPPEQTGCVVRIQDNLFYRVQRVMRVDDLLPPLPASLTDRLRKTFTTTEGNVRDPSSAEGLPSLNCSVLDFKLPADPNKDREFLRYSSDSPLCRAGANQGNAGVPPR